MSALERLLGDFGASAGAAAPARQAAARALREHGLPGRGEENWRYANLRALDAVRSFRPPAAAAGSAAGASAGTGAAANDASGLPPTATQLALPAALPGYERLVLVDGRLRSDLSTIGADLSRALCTPAGDAATGFDAAGDGRLGLIATLFAPEPLSLSVQGSLALELVSVSTPGAGPTYLELTVALSAGARLALVERHLGADDAQAFSCIRQRLAVGAGAQLTQHRLLASAAGGLYIDSLSADVAEQGHYRLHQVAVGAATARSSAQVRLLGRAAALQWQALAAGTGRQVHDILLQVLHEAPGTRTDQLFRGIASDHARVACNGDMLVAAGARGAQVVQSLRGLIDGDGAEVDLRPRLTINTDDIQARHGATTGRLDDDLLFYLLSRGLSPEQARALLKWAFLGEVLTGFAPAALRQAAERAAAARLDDAPAAELLQ